MKSVSGVDLKLFAARKHWSSIRAEGYVDGRLWRERGLPLTKTNMIGIDEYACGFRAGYFSRGRTLMHRPHP